MVNIIHRVGIKGHIDDIYRALTTDEGLSTWWTSTTSGAGEVGSIIHFAFNDTIVKFKVAALIKNKQVTWQHHGDMPPAWMGTTVSFELEDIGGQIFINFSQSDWSEASSFMGHCSTKWAVFLLSLKDAIEKNEGKPFPNDIHIDHDE